MADGTTTQNLFDQIPTFPEVLSNNWPGNAQVGGWDFSLGFTGKSVSYQQSEGGEIYDYFLIDLTGWSALGTIDGRPPAGFRLYIDFGNQAPSSAGQGLDLLQSSPGTTTATTSYSSDISHSFHGSVAFSSKGVTVSFGGSTTISHTTTKTVSDLEILNQSGMNGTPNCDWSYAIAAGSDEAKGQVPLTAQALLCRPHSDAPLQFLVEVDAYFSNEGLSDDLDWSGLDAHILGFSGDDLPPLDAGNARIAMQYNLTMDAPPVPTNT
jgi:hypothetical protein